MAEVCARSLAHPRRGPLERVALKVVATFVVETLASLWKVGDLERVDISPMGVRCFISE